MKTSCEEHFKRKAISVFPNPSTGKFVIDEIPNEIGVELLVFDVSGMMIQKINFIPNSETYLLDLGNAPSGVYFLKVVSKDDIVTKRIIKE